jgi:DNA helicase II / ATP-dependent DNA helicase PcrA
MDQRRHQRFSASIAKTSSSLAYTTPQNGVTEKVEEGEEEFTATRTRHSHITTSDSQQQHILLDLNPSQIQAVTQLSRAITRVVAGPGSGKTRVLTCRIAYLLQQDAQARILGVTFTRKAAGEMQNRLEKLLRSGEQGEEDRVAVELNQDARPRGLDRVTLATFHSICAKILRWNGELLSTLPCVIYDMKHSRNATFLDGSFGIVDQAGQLRILKECLDEANIQLETLDLKPLPVLTAIGQFKAKLAQGDDPFLPPKPKEPQSKAFKVASKVYIDSIAKSC